MNKIELHIDINLFKRTILQKCMKAPLVSVVEGNALKVGLSGEQILPTNKILKHIAPFFVAMKTHVR